MYEIKQVRRKIAEDYQLAFEQIDLIMAPVSPDIASNLGELINDPIKMYQADLFTLGVNLAGLPSLALPSAFVKEMPMGFQLIGPRLSEEKLLQTGHAFQLATDYHLKRPPCHWET